MELKRAGSQPSIKGPADWFTGTVRIDPSMTHIAVQEALDGRNVVWMEPVTDAQYAAGPAPHVAHPH
jgi:hypothetical protein